MHRNLPPFQQLETEFSNFISSRGAKEKWHVVVCSTGTAALHLALCVVTKGRSDLKVAVPNFSMVACPRSVLAAGHTPVLHEVDNDGLMQVVYNSEVDIVLQVHNYGRTAKTDFKVPVIEDLAENHLQAPNDNSIAACYSFYQNKLIGGEEGGAVAFRDPELAEQARSMRSMNRIDPYDYRFREPGFSYRLSNANAKEIQWSLRQVAVNTRMRENQIEMYDNCLHTSLERLPSRVTPWVYDVDLPEPLNRINQRHLVRKLNDKGIAARCSFEKHSRSTTLLGCDMQFTLPTYGVSARRFTLPLGKRVNVTKVISEVEVEMNRLLDVANVG